MRAWQYSRYGRPDVLELANVATPRPRHGQILVAVRAAALNPKDGLLRRGAHRFLSGSQFPKQLGCDFAGEVLEIGAGVFQVRPGQRVWGCLDELRGRRGTLAECVIVKERECAVLPEEIGFEEACGSR